MSLSYDLSCLSKASIFYPKTATPLHQAEVPAQPCYHSRQIEELCIFLTGPHTLPRSPPGTGLSVQLTELITRQKLQLGSSCYTAHWPLVKRVNVIKMCPETSAHIPTHVHSPAPYSYSSFRGYLLMLFVVKEDKCPTSPQYCPHGSGGKRNPKTFQANSATWTVELNAESLDNLSGIVWKGLQRVHLIPSAAAARLWDPSGLQMYLRIALQICRRMSIA